MTISRALCASLFVSACISQQTSVTNGAAVNNQFYGPGDRPSVCLERAESYISPNLKPMTKLAEALSNSNEIDEIGLIRTRDEDEELSMLFKGKAVEPSERLSSKFTRLFDELPWNFFTPTHFYVNEKYVIARPGYYFPGIITINSGPWCGGTDEDWKAESEKQFSAGVSRGGPIFYAYDSDAIKLEKPCSDEAFLTEDAGFCDLKLNKNWAIVFEYVNNLGVE